MRETQRGSRILPSAQIYRAAVVGAICFAGIGVAQADPVHASGSTSVTISTDQCPRCSGSLASQWAEADNPAATGKSASVSDPCKIVGAWTG